MAFEHLLYESTDGVVTLTINRPQALNALNSDVIRELRDALARFHEAAHEHILVLTGATGEKAPSFVAGADIKEMAEMTEAEAMVFAQKGQAVTRLLSEGDKLTIAAVDGFALGGGCELALACDFIVASERSKLGQPEVKLGVIPGFGGTQRLARRVGVARATYLIATGRNVGADEARQIGLVDKVVPDGEALQAALKMACQMIGTVSLEAVGAARAVIREGFRVDMAEALHLEARAFARGFTTSDQREGMAAFVEKRPPHFKHRD
jgi:enoyl-CoA hydratase